MKIFFLFICFSLLFFSCTNSSNESDTSFANITRTVKSKAVDIKFSASQESSRNLVTDSTKVAYFNLNMVADNVEYDVSNLKFNKNEAYSFVAKKDFSATVSIDAFDENDILIAHGSKYKEFKVNHEPSETNVIITLDQIHNNTTSDYKFIPTIHDTSNLKTDDVLDYYRFNSDKTLLTFDSEKGPFYQIDLKNIAILSCTSSNAEIKFFLLENDLLTIDLYSDELPYNYEYIFDLNDIANQSSIGENNYIFNATDYEGNQIPTDCTHEILSGENYVTISANGVNVAQVILPTEQYGNCEILWSSIKDLACEGQIIYSNKYAISTYVNGIWKQNKHENWNEPAIDSAGNSILGTGESGACDYNFRYSIETSLGETEDIYLGENNFDKGTYQEGEYIKSTTILRSDNHATTECQIFDTFFSFDFDDGALFHISLEDGTVLYTSETMPIEEYIDSYGVLLTNFTKEKSRIEFDLIDGEYSSETSAHYILSL